MRLRNVASVILSAALAACDSETTAPGLGRLGITVTGLPSGAEPAVTVSGPDGFSVAITASATLDDLRAGTYTITALDVTADQARYAASPAAQTIIVSPGALATASEITYAIATARLVISVHGLPSGAASDIAVSGPNGFLRTITGSTTLELLVPGTYSLSASDVQGGGTTYRADPSAQTVLLTPGATPVSAMVAYGAGNGTLELSIAGLPPLMDAGVIVTGPASYARTVKSSGTLRYLDAGTYTISSTVVGRDLTTYRATVPSVTIVVTDGATRTVSVSYQGTPLRLRVGLVVDGLTLPVFLDAPEGDARLFVLERIGRVQIVVNGVVRATPFLDITSRVNSAGERGMLGVAFDPAYATNGRFYVYYVDLSGAVVLERFASVPGSSVAGASDGIVIRIPHGGSEHHGGMIAFGPDGMLYLAPGDGGCCRDPQNNGQRTNTLLGKLLRIDVRALPYTIPPSNPFVGREGALPEIWAYGLRSPWRFSFDAAAKLLYIGDVGEDTREEVNVSPSTAAGLNYGWRLMEGTACFNPSAGCSAGATLTLPMHEYTRADGCSVIGGYVYRGSAIPELTGRYLYSDYCRGWLRSFRATSGGAAEHRVWSDVSLPQTVSFGRDGAGELYMIAAGRLWRIARG